MLLEIVLLAFIKMYYTVVFVWLSGLAALWALRKPLPFAYRLFAWMVVVLSLQLTAAYILAFNNIPNHALFNFFDPLEFFLVPLFFRFQLTSAWLKRVITGYLFIFPIFVLVNLLWIQDLQHLATNSYVAGAAFTLLLCVAYLWQLYNSEDTESIYIDPVFWISLGYVFYTAVSIPYLGMLNDLWNKHPQFTRQYYFIMYYGAIIVNRIFLTIALLCLSRSANRS